MGFDAQEFAKLMARFDTGNASEAEAVSAARMMRRMVASEGLRFVDVMERAEVKKALDAQLQPVREDSAELKEAFAKITELAKALAQERGITAQLQQECDRLRSSPSAQPVNGTSPTSLPIALINGWLEAFIAVLAAALLIAAALN